MTDNQRLLDRFMTEVCGEPAILVGNSMGGLIAVLQTSAHPEAVAGLAASLEDVADHQRVIVAGFSQGGAMAVAVATHLARHRPALGLQLVVVAGFLPGEVELTHLPPASNAHALVVLGDADEVVDPFHGELVARRLGRCGWTVTQWHHPGGHQWHEAITAEVLGWLRR